MLVVSIACSSFSALQGSIIAYDNFDYPDGALLAGQTGGTGWDGNAWISATGGSLVPVVSSFGGRTTIKFDNTSGGVLATNEAAYREFPLYDGDSLFLSFTFAISGSGNPNFHTLWLDNSGLGTSHFAAFNAGIGADRKLFSRSRSHADETIETGIDVEKDVFYTMVLHIFKNGDVNNYNSMQLWINPEPGDLASPDFENVTELASGRTSFTYLGIRLHSQAPDLDFHLAEVALGTSWNAVIPEPSTYAAILGLLVALVVAWRRRHLGR